MVSQTASTSWPAGSAVSSLGRPVKIAERIASTIVGMIVENNLQPGDRLPNEADMLEQFDVGRGSLREALRILETYGLINLRSGPGGGPILLDVRPTDVSRSFSLYLNLSGATIEELAATRHLIDPLAARMAAETVTDESAALIRAALDREDGSSAQDRRLVFDTLNDFHYVLASVTGNRVFNSVATALKEMYTSRLAAVGLAEQVAEPIIGSEHRAIGEAVIAGNADLAEKLMHEHMIRRVDDALKLPGFADSPITWG